MTPKQPPPYWEELQALLLSLGFRMVVLPDDDARLLFRRDAVRFVIFVWLERLGGHRVEWAVHARPTSITELIAVEGVLRFRALADLPIAVEQAQARAVGAVLRGRL